MRGFIEAYEQLVWARNNRPTPEQLKEIETERLEAQHRAKLQRLRRGVA